MLVKNIIYRGVSLSDDDAKTNHVVLSQEHHDVDLRTEVIQKQNTHGSYSSFTLASGRLFTISGVIFGTTKADRHIGWNLINNLCRIEAIPTDSNNGFYELSWEDQNGTRKKVMAKVYKKPKFENGLDDPQILFTFELYCDSNAIEEMTTNSGSGVSGSVGGMKLMTKLPAKMNNKVNDFTITNAGNYPAGCKITISGYALNPKIMIGERWFKLNTSTTTLIIDSTESVLTATNEGVNVLPYRVSGSKTPLVMPGANVVVFECENLDPLATVLVEWNNTNEE